MKVKSLGKNITEIEINRDNKRINILISYETPVAAIFESGHFTKVLRTTKFHSQTTTRHINQWFKDIFAYDPNVEEKEQDFFNNLLD